MKIDVGECDRCNRPMRLGRSDIRPGVWVCPHCGHEHPVLAPEPDDDGAGRSLPTPVWTRYRPILPLNGGDE